MTDTAATTDAIAHGPLTLPAAQAMAVMITALELGCTVDRVIDGRWREVVPRRLAGPDGGALPADLRDAVAEVELFELPEPGEPVGEGGGPLRRWPLADLVADHERGFLRLRP